jgi:hypothetical protein
MGLPPSTQAEIDGILADLRTAVQKWGVLADKIDSFVDKGNAALDAIKATADAGTQAIPLIQADVKEIADAAKNLHGTGPLGTKFSTQQ